MQDVRVVRPSLRVLLVVMAAVVLTGGLVATAGAAAEKVELCHLPGTPDEATLVVAENAVGSHINHGDVLGSCEELPPPPVLGEVMDRGTLNCGVSNGGAIGFSEFDGSTWSGLDVDLCRAVAAAVLGDADAVEFVMLSTAARFQAVRDGVVDVLIRTTTDTLTRDATFENGGPGVNFGPTYFYDGAGILARTDAVGCLTPEECDFFDLEGTVICAVQGTAAEAGLVDLIGDLGIDADVEVTTSFGESIDKFIDGECDAITFDQSALVGLSDALGGPPDLVIFAETFTEEPLAPVVRDGDDEWMAVVRWAVFATFLAEELGLDQANIAAGRNSSAKASLAFGDAAAITGERLGLGPNWGFDIIDQVGNYAEMYDDNLTPLGLARGRNASYLDGGLIYAPPIR